MIDGVSAASSSTGAGATSVSSGGAADANFETFLKMLTTGCATKTR